MSKELSKLEDEISLKELIQKVQSIFSFLLKKWYLIFIAATLCSALGILSAWIKPIKYTAGLTFVAEESKSSMSGLASLAGQFGVDIGGSSGSGVFTGENILMFLKSETLIRETLFTPYSESGTETLADKYAEVYKYKKAWAKNPKIGNIDFSKYVDKNLPRKEDSLLQVLIADVSKEYTVDRNNKKATFIEVTTTTRDEAFSKLFTERIVKTGTEWYIQTKTKVKAANVALLQKRADSLGALLNANTYSAAAAQQPLVDVNPALRTAPVGAEIATRNKLMLSTIFGEVVKNLEMAKFALSQETPVIQVVDRPYYPLVRVKESKLKGLLIGGFLGAFLAIAYLLANKWWKELMA
jgi:hypothetical protein